MPTIQRKHIAAAIAKAAAINRTIKVLTEQLDGLKAGIRKEAEKISAARGDDSMVEFASPAGVCTVCFVQDAVTAGSGKNLWELKLVLPTVTWEDMFVEKVALAQDFNEKFQALPAGKVKTTIDRYLEETPRGPRVILPK